jgi:hypothetical protein
MMVNFTIKYKLTLVYLYAILKTYNIQKQLLLKLLQNKCLLNMEFKIIYVTEIYTEDCTLPW